MSSKQIIEDYLSERPELDGVILFTDGMHSVRAPSLFERYANVSPVADRNCLIVTASGKSAIVVNLSRDVDRIRRQSYIADIRASPEFESSVGETLKDLSLTGNIGATGINRMPQSVYGKIESTVERIHDVTSDISELSREKTTSELQAFRKLGRIADAGFKTLYETLEPGKKEYEIAAEVEYAMNSAGAEDNFNLFGSGSKNQLLHSPTERIVRRGDTFLCELSPMYEGFVLQICRTVSVGSPDSVLSEKASLLENALRQTKSRLEPGIEASVISETMNNAFRKEGYGEYCQPPYMRTRGHEFGYGPIGMSITEDTNIELTKGMILVIHPNQFIPETGYLALGDPVLITEGGAKTLTTIEPRMFTKEVI